MRLPRAILRRRSWLRETQAVATANANAADYPAIWRNSANPAESLIVGTDKQAGINVYDLTGRQRHFVDAGRVNNIDLVDASIGGMPAVLVAASDRNDIAAARIALFRLEPRPQRWCRWAWCLLVLAKPMASA